MLTDRQSLTLSGIIILSFVFFGIIGVLNNPFIIVPIIICFIVLIVNLIITKRLPEDEELKQMEEEKSLLD